MRGLISPEHYRDLACLRDEQNVVFARAWQFVGLLLEFDGLSHCGLQVGDTDVLIQIDKSGRPRAYRNVCSHRHAQLCAPGLHGGPVRCPYHGWVYDREGVPAGIPQPKAFPAVVANPAAFRLSEFACDAAGQFVFVRLASQGPSLAEYLGPERDFLLRASEGMNGV
ncbi:MAG: aromatic ring-hydroxylating oxygenase subunit alpha, partial [Burkholderiaceae bacterium]